MRVFEHEKIILAHSSSSAFAFFFVAGIQLCLLSSWMSLDLGILETGLVLAFGRYFCKRCCHSGYDDSKDWSPASYEEFEPIPRMCRIVLSVYEEDLSHPKWAPEGGYRMNLDCVFKRAVYKDTQGHVAPYLIYVDHDAKDIVLAIRGLNLGKKKDYEALLNNKPGKEPFAKGFVHCGLLKSARWLFNEEEDRLKGLLSENPDYTLSVTGHSLGSGVAAMFVMLVANDRSILDNIPRRRLRSYAIAPTRCMSLNLAIQHADIIYSIILQDDFLPRMVTPLEDIFKSIFCLPCLLFSRCLKDTFMREKRALDDPRRLYTPGTVFHIVDRRFCGTGTLPPYVRRAVPVEGRFEHVILSCNATKDHSLIWIEKETQKALKVLQEDTDSLEPPAPQKMRRKESMKDQHQAALDKANTLKIPSALSYINEDEESSVKNLNDDKVVES